MNQNKMTAPVLAHRDGRKRAIVKKHNPIVPYLRGAVKCACVTLGVYLLAAIVAVKDVIEGNTRPEDHKACAQVLAELLVELMDQPVTTIDLGAIMGGGYAA